MILFVSVMCIGFGYDLIANPIPKYPHESNFMEYFMGTMFILLGLTGLLKVVLCVMIH